MKCRKAHLEDLDIIFKIEQKLFNQPWTKKSIYNELNRSKNTLNLVAEIDEKIIGYFFSHFFEREAHILNLAIDFPYQHKGLGKIFLNKIKLEDLLLAKHNGYSFFLGKYFFIA